MAEFNSSTGIPIDAAPNGAAPESQPVAQPTPQKKKSPKRKGPNYAQLHAKPLPLDVHPLPAFHPSHPVSLLRLAYAFLSQLLAPSSSHTARYAGHFSTETRSVHITDPAHIRALWEMGFFGKGTLSRSEPSWLEREKARLKAASGGKPGSAEEATRLRREQRRLFKLERARVERAMIERQRLIEEGKMTQEEADALAKADAVDEAQINGSLDAQNSLESGRVLENGTASSTTGLNNTELDEDIEVLIENQEHLQLTLEEAFFLSYGLGVLDITTSSPSTPIKPNALLPLFVAHATFPPQPIPSPSAFSPDSAFLLNYVVYHHFRSLGWVVRPGVKFSCDYLLYNRGPVFSHAEFAILIMPSYTHAFWKTVEGHELRRVKEERDWWWLHCVNRVQSQVRKTLVLVYVEIPPPVSGDAELGVGCLLRRYKVREFVIRRWLANRSRD
ncbi:Hypothetical protein R9X50_00661400 [Acrodontium crateriforme]|uniref:tRNA-splicing endonuclease subunit Sen2 n=1 Tax=Acrodontium crateriforme TaxID=150365 RepID=A0AAQ3MBX4_9PEZI|nr:Hypothetical protein R9X50_00661400 [Acrodontium crateriforme]